MLQQLCDNAPEWVYSPFSSISIDLNENRIASIITVVAVLTLMLGVNRPLNSAFIAFCKNPSESDGDVCFAFDVSQCKLVLNCLEFNPELLMKEEKCSITVRQ